MAPIDRYLDSKHLDGVVRACIHEYKLEGISRWMRRVRADDGTYSWHRVVASEVKQELLDMVEVYGIRGEAVRSGDRSEVYAALAARFRDPARAELLAQLYAEVEAIKQRIEAEGGKIDYS